MTARNTITRMQLTQGKFATLPTAVDVNMHVTKHVQDENKKINKPTVGVTVSRATTYRYITSNNFQTAQNEKMQVTIYFDGFDFFFLFVFVFSFFFF